MSEVEPLIQEARSAVGSIKAEALSEIRSLRAPPEIIRDILEGVLRLMGIQDTSWNSMKTFLAKRGVKEEIRYDNIYLVMYSFPSLFYKNFMFVDPLMLVEFKLKTAKLLKN